MSVFDYLVLALAVLFAVATWLPFWPTKTWWVRAMDIARLHLLIAGGAVLLLALAASGGVQAVALILVCPSLLWQGYRILPYTPAFPPEVDLAAPGAQDTVFLAANVLMENRDPRPLLDLIAADRPDVLFLMETDRRWIEALEGSLTGYTTVLREPRDNYYGLVFATRLRVRKAEVVELTPDDTPSVFAELETAEGRVFRFVGLHPRPPVPGEDTADRDAQLYYTARFAKNSGTPVVIMGDFNIAAWSDAAQTFKTVGHYLDPRVGRGPLPSFDTRSRLLRFPIDQLYLTPEVVLTGFERGPDIGSDHFPISARMRFDADEAARLNRSIDPLPEARERQILAAIERHEARLEQKPKLAEEVGAA